MSLEDVVEGVGLSPDTTIAELRSIYGEESVRRALNYMDKLSEADKNFRESAEEDKMIEGYSEFLTDSNITSREEESEWQRGMKENGLGIDDE